MREISADILTIEKEAEGPRGASRAMMQVLLAGRIVLI